MNITREWNFGSDPIIAEHLKALVLSGKKTATTGLYMEGQEIAKPGDIAVIDDHNGQRFCTIEYIHAEIKPFLDVDFNFIKKEGEDDKSVEEWRAKHRRFFHLDNDNVKVVCEEFRLINVL